MSHHENLSLAGVKCWREADGTAVTNVARTVVQHSPTGFEWDYPGSGPADLALNILAHFLPINDDDDLVECAKGSVSAEAWQLHQDFKWHFLAKLPREGVSSQGRQPLAHAGRPGWRRPAALSVTRRACGEGFARYGRHSLRRRC